MFSIGVEEKTCEFLNETAKINNGARSLFSRSLLTKNVKQVNYIHLNAWLILTDLPTILLWAEFLLLDCTSCHCSTRSKIFCWKRRKKRKKIKKEERVLEFKVTSIVVHCMCRSCQTWRCDFVTEVLEGCRTMQSGRPSWWQPLTSPQW